MNCRHFSIIFVSLLYKFLVSFVWAYLVSLSVAPSSALILVPAVACTRKKRGNSFSICPKEQVAQRLSTSSYKKANQKHSLFTTTNHLAKQQTVQTDPRGATANRGKAGTQCCICSKVSTIGSRATTKTW
jgi:hypothetical protein